MGDAEGGALFLESAVVPRMVYSEFRLHAPD
jgi:hypothetical protein